MSKLFRILKKIPLFRGMENHDLEHLLCFLEEEQFDMEENILQEYEADEGAKMYIILEGGVEVLKKAPSKDEEEIHLNILKPGESFGEMALVDVMVRSATVRAIAPTRVLSLSRWNLNRLFELHPRVYGILMRNIAQQISRRLRKADVLQAFMLYKDQMTKQAPEKEETSSSETSSPKPASKEEEKQEPKESQPSQATGAVDEDELEETRTMRLSEEEKEKLLRKVKEEKEEGKG
ncbi:MAG: cyclic nucleotide-binding domain-containing protein, partial [Planctomycetota bacterium]